MKRFQFRLDTLLKFRKMQEEQAQIRLAEATDALRQERERMTVLENKFEVNTEVLRQCQKEGSIVDILKMYRLYLDKIKRDMIIQNGVILQAEAHHQSCLKAMEEAMKKRKLVENLKVYRQQQHDLEELREEQKLLDEMGIQLFTREK